MTFGALDVDVWMCSSLWCENGCCFIGFVGAIQGKQRLYEGPPDTVEGS